MEHAHWEIHPYMVWDMGERSEIRSIEHLEALIEKLTLEAQNNMPFTIEIHLNETTSILMVVGLTESHLEFYAQNGNPFVVGSHGALTAEEVIAFLHHGEYTEVPKKFWVPFEEAKAAFLQRFRTGKRPDHIQWDRNRSYLVSSARITKATT